MKLYKNYHRLGWSIVMGDDGVEHYEKSGFSIHFIWLVFPCYIRINIATKKRLIGWGLQTQFWNWEKDENGQLKS